MLWRSWLAGVLRAHAGEADAIAAIHRQHDAGDVGSLIARQEEGRGGDVSGEAPAVQRDAGKDEDAGRRLGMLGGLLNEAGPGGAGGHGVDADVLARIVE